MRNLITLRLHFLGVFQSNLEYLPIGVSTGHYNDCVFFISCGTLDSFDLSHQDVQACGIQSVFVIKVTFFFIEVI